MPPRESGRDWSESGRDDGGRSQCSLSSSSYDTAGSTHVFGSVGSSFASIDHHHDAASEPRTTTTTTVIKAVTKTSDDPRFGGRNPSSSRLGPRGLDGSGSALAALQDAIASGVIDPPAPTTTSRPRRRSEPEPMHLQSLLFSTMHPKDADDDAEEKPEPKRRSVDEQEFADRMGIPPASNPGATTVTRQKTPRGLPVMTQLVDRRAASGSQWRWGEWGAGAFDSFPDELPSASPRGSGEWRRRRSFSAGDMELRAAAMAAVKSVREDQARSRVGSPVA